MFFFFCSPFHSCIPLGFLSTAGSAFMAFVVRTHRYAIHPVLAENNHNWPAPRRGRLTIIGQRELATHSIPCIRTNMQEPSTATQKKKVIAPHVIGRAASRDRLKFNRTISELQWNDERSLAANSIILVWNLFNSSLRRLAGEHSSSKLVFYSMLRALSRDRGFDAFFVPNICPFVLTID